MIAVAGGILGGGGLAALLKLRVDRRAVDASTSATLVSTAAAVVDELREQLADQGRRIERLGALVEDCESRHELTTRELRDAEQAIGQLLALVPHEQLQRMRRPSPQILAVAQAVARRLDQQERG